MAGVDSPTSFSPQQDEAMKAVAAWLKNERRKQVFRLFGYAGTGKTTLAKHIAGGIEGRVSFGAFTGKAALVLRKKGCNDASTIHSLIYRPDEEKHPGAPVFVLNEDSAVRDSKLVIIDECSMVDEELGRDLLSFRTPILVLGDPAQLPPVKGGGFFTEDTKPDFLLTEVHRQAADNPILRLASDVRHGRKLSYGEYGESSVISRRDIDAERVLKADQVLLGLNDSRRLYNKRIRELRDYPGQYPTKDERLVCLRNNRQKGLFNGGIWNVAEVRSTRNGAQKMVVRSEDFGEDAQNVEITVMNEFFEGTENTLEWKIRKKSDEFDFGYALTVHKSQGSQWDDVVLFDESGCFREDGRRWLYTGITRAAERLTVVM